MYKLIHITKEYKTKNGIVHALDSIDLDIKNRGLYLIYGQSGSGKSTLLNLLAEFEKQTEGTIERCCSSNEIGVVFQSSNLLEELTVKENLLIFGFSLEVIEENLSKVNLLDKLNEKVKVLSGGEKQRLSIVRAVLKDIQVLLLDEPTGNLDEINSLIVFDLLKELSKELDISVPNLSYYMKGREPSYDILIKIADYYNVTTDWLLGRTDERNTAQSSVIEEIEKQLGLDDTEKLSGDNRRLFLKDQYTLYDAMVNIYRFFLLCENNHSIILTHNVYLLMLCSIIEYHMDEFNKVICNISKETILNLMRKEELIADVARSTILLSSYTYADGLAHEQ